MSSLEGLSLIISSSYLFWGNILFSYFTLIELDISILDEPRSYLWLILILIFFGLLIPFLSPSGCGNMCFLLMMCHMIVRRENLEDIAQSHIINTLVALVSCRAWKCVVIGTFHLVTTFTTLWSRERKVFFI